MAGSTSFWTGLGPPRQGPVGLAALLVLGWLAWTPDVAQAGALEQEMLKHAPALMKNLREEGYQNVGVLKFRVKKGAADYSDSVGTLNLSLAQRVEMALVLVNDPAPDRQLGILQDVSAVAARLQGASHLNPQGRQVLFSASYPLAWGNKSAKPDALVTGVAVISPDLREMKVVMGPIDSQSSVPKRERTVAFTVPVESELLSEMGESFLVRGFFTGGKINQVDPSKAVASAAKVKSKAEPYPLDDASEAPVTLEIWYGKSKVPFNTTSGKAVIRPPQLGEKVSFRIVRNKPGRYGIVLKVNGENTIFQERLPDHRCHKWILEPDMDKIDIVGYAVKGEKSAREFKVLTPSESKAYEVYYGADVGTYSLTVYGEQDPGAIQEQPRDDNYAALVAGFYPQEKPDTLVDLQRTLRYEAGGASRIATRGLGGLVGAGNKVATEGTRVVPFKANPSPLMSATITYYQVR